MASGKNDAALLECTDTGPGATVAGTLALANLDKDSRAIDRSHDQINFSTTPPRGPIIANNKAQTRLLQIDQRGIFSRIAHLLGRQDLSLDLRNIH
jgi:hypothetical protein